VPLRKPSDSDAAPRLDIRPQFARFEEVGEIPREALREEGMSPGTAYDMSVLRVVVRNGLSWDMARILLADLKAAVERLERVGGDPSTNGRAGFHH